MRRATRAAEQFGEIGFELHTPAATDKVNRLLRRGFEVEDSSWKGEAGSSVLSNPGMFDFFAHQAQQLATWGQLAVSLLTINGEAIALEYALAAKGVYAPVKVGYDPRFSEVKPGQLLRWHLLRTLHTEGRWSGVDFVGPISHATARWSTTTYRLCRMVIAPPRFSSRLLLAGYRMAKYRGNVSETISEPALLAEDRSEPAFAATSAD
jgi:CelD/BcsL family acetyltransferase involved in cellulose biosynthesis